MKKQINIGKMTTLRNSVLTVSAFFCIIVGARICTLAPCRRAIAVFYWERDVGLPATGAQQRIYGNHGGKPDEIIYG